MVISLRSIVRYATVALFLLVCGLLVQTDAVHAGPLTPNYRFEGANKIVVSGGFMTDGGDGGQPLFYNGVFGDAANVDSQFYDTQKSEVFFRKKGGQGLFYTEVNQYFGGGRNIPISGNERCYAAIKVKAGGTSGEYVGAIMGKDGPVQNDGCTASIKSIIADTDYFDSTILGTIRNPQQSTDAGGTNITTCKSDDGPCLTKRKKAIDAFEAANRCYTGSTSDLSNCKFNQEVVACLRKEPGNTYKKCLDAQQSQAILDGDFTGITADTTNEDLKERCELLPGDKQKECLAKATEYRDSLKDGGENVTACNIGALGWVICPFIRFLAGITDAAYEYITEMLVVPTSVLFVQNQNAPGSLYKPWSIMRNVANVAFVIAFMIIIYSQITSMGVSNYGIKKMLPRLIISALLVNSSFWIAGLAVEISNVIGESTYTLLGGTNLYSATPTQDQANWVALSDRAVIGLTAGGAVGTGLLTSSILIPILLGAALAIMIAVFVLTIRQAFIIGLIIIAPLAFVAFLLPNTEDWFKRWWKVFKTLLLLFPVIALIFGASSVASQVLNEVAKTYTEPLLKFVMEVMAAGVQILPLFLTTILTNVTQGTLGKLTGMVNNKNKGLLDRSKNFARDRQKYRNEATKAGYGRFGKRKSNWNPMKRAGGFGRTMDKFNRTQKTDMERFDNELETDWRSSGSGGRAIQAQMSSSQNLGKVKVDAEVQNITNPSNTTLQAEVEASNINLAKAKSDLETRNTKNPALTGIQTAAGVAEMQATAAKSELNASIAKEVAHGTSPLGAAGRAAMTDKYISELSKGSSDRVTQQNSAEALQNSSTLQGIAAGADTIHGINRAKGAATQTLDQLGKERVEMEKRSDLRNLDGDALNTIMRDVNGASVERRAAAASLIGVNGEDKHIANMIDYLGDSTDTGIGDIQQQVAQDLKRKPDLFGSADMSKLARAAYGAAEIDPTTGNMKGRATAGRTFESNAIERIKKGKISGSSVASMSPGQIEMFKDMMTTNPRTKFTEEEFDAVQKEILEFRTDPLLQSKQPDVNIQEFMDEIGTFTF